MRGFFLLMLLVLAWCLTACEQQSPPPTASIRVDEAMGGTPDPGFARAFEPRAFSFPGDHGPHPDFATEWWYLTGNLESDDGRRFGYQLTLFRVGLRPGEAAQDSDWRSNQLYMGHLAVSDIAGARHHSAERFARAAAGLAGAGNLGEARRYYEHALITGADADTVWSEAAAAWTAAGQLAEPVGRAAFEHDIGAEVEGLFGGEVPHEPAVDEEDVARGVRHLPGGQGRHRPVRGSENRHPVFFQFCHHGVVQPAAVHHRSHPSQQLTRRFHLAFPQPQCSSGFCRC